jgi:hypothetical protein
MLARYSKLEKKQLSDGAVPSNFGAEFWPLIGILGGFAVMFGERQRARLLNLEVKSIGGIEMRCFTEYVQYLYWKALSIY